MQKKKYLFPAILGLLLIVTGILLIIILPFSEKEEKTINKNPVPTSTPEATMPPEDSIISYTKHTYYICQKEPTEITHEAFILS